MRRKKPAVPPGERVCAIGDIHGRSDLLRTVFDMVLPKAAGSNLVFLGDYIDRGPDSRGVIDMLLDLPRGLNAHFIRGNHDQALLDFLDRPSTYPMWRDFGGGETLRSYGVQPPATFDPQSLIEASALFAQSLPPEHLRFLSDLRPSVEIGDYLFVHAGVRPGVALTMQSAEDMMWIRDEFLSSDEDFGKVVVHGHSPSNEPVFRHNRIGIDTGAYLTGRLTALMLEGTHRRVLHS